MNLCTPERLPCLGFDEMVWASMPEATVDEDVQARSTEGDVCSPTTVEGKRLIYAEAQSMGMEDRTNRKFGASVTGSVRLHGASGFEGNRFGSSEGSDVVGHVYTQWLEIAITIGDRCDEV